MADDINNIAYTLQTLSDLGNASRRSVHDTPHFLVASKDSNGTIRIDIHDDNISLLDVSSEDALREAVLDETHDGTAQGAGTIGRVEAILN